MDRSTSSLYTRCEGLFDTLAKAVSQQLLRASLTNAKVQDEFDRFRIWGGNLGARHSVSTKISLDWRLRNAIELKEEIILLLEEIASALEDLYEIVNGTREDQITIIDAENDEESQSLTVSEAAELFGIVSDSIAGLFRLSLIIQKATPRDRFLKALTNIQEPFDPTYDVQHVGAKFPKLDCKENAWLQQKLASAITQRRQFFRYSRDHQERKSKLKTGLPAVEQSRGVRSGQTQADMLSQIHPESLVQTQASTLVLDRLDTARFNADEAEDSLSQTSFATSVDDSNNHNKLRVPKLEDISGKSREFECPYCCTIIAPRNQRQWKKHVFEDLRPYICTSEDCDTKLFIDRRTWFDHELSKHRCLYKCLFCQSTALHSEKELHKHISTYHNEMVASTTSEKLLEAAKEAPQSFAAAECPFCDEWAYDLRIINPHILSDDIAFVTPQQFRNHLATHMEQLALFALPRHHDDDSNEGSAVVVAGSNQWSLDDAAGNSQVQSLDQPYPLIHEDYTVALISRSDDFEELALKMLDKQHPNLPVSNFDPNHYSLGQISHHNVVLVILGGKTDDEMSLSTSTLFQTFSKLRFGFSIDIGSGFPGDPNEDPRLDLHLGDVVVYHQSLLNAESFSNLKPGGNTLPLAVRYALKTISAQIEGEGRRIKLFLDSVLADSLALREKYGYPGDPRDRLFISDSAYYARTRHDKPRYIAFHYSLRPVKAGTKVYPPCFNCRGVAECIMAYDSCVQCKKDRCRCMWDTFDEDLVRRKTREDPSVPSVHFSRIVGMNELTANTEIRDKLLRDDGVLCMGNDPVDLFAKFPCLTVRGIGYYGLNHLEFANWRPYAIGVATAYALHILDWIQEPLDHKDLDWLVQKEKISHLYQSGHSIPEIRDKMGKTCGFDATPYQYQQKVATWRLGRHNTAENRYINRQSQLTEGRLDGEEEEVQVYRMDFTVKCVCLNPESNGAMWDCNNCKTWQHEECYYEPEDIPSEQDTHYCIDCEPRFVDVARAVAIQTQRKDEELQSSQQALDDLRLQRKKDHEETVRMMERDLDLTREEDQEKLVKTNEEDPKGKGVVSEMRKRVFLNWNVLGREVRYQRREEKEIENSFEEYLRQLRSDGFTEEEIEILMTKKQRPPSPNISEMELKMGLNTFRDASSKQTEESTSNVQESGRRHESVRTYSVHGEPLSRPSDFE